MDWFPNSADKESASSSKSSHANNGNNSSKKATKASGIHSQFSSDMETPVAQPWNALPHKAEGVIPNSAYALPQTARLFNHLTLSTIQPLKLLFPIIFSLRLLIPYWGRLQLLLQVLLVYCHQTHPVLKVMLLGLKRSRLYYLRMIPELREIWRIILGFICFSKDLTSSKIFQITTMLLREQLQSRLPDEHKLIFIMECFLCFFKI